MEHVLGSKPVNRFWCSGLQCRCSIIRVFRWKSVSIHGHFKAYLGYTPAAWTAALCLTLPSLKMGENWAPALDELLFLLHSRHRALNISFAGLAHGSQSCLLRKCFPHTGSRHHGGIDGNIRTMFDIAPNQGTAAITPVLAITRVPGAGFTQHWVSLP